MLNVQGLRRNVKNVVRNYTDAQVKVREATSNDPWGPSSTLMSEIADLTYNVVAFSEIMQMIWKRLNDHGKNWRHVYKALVLLEYLIKTGSEKVAQQCKENIFAIQTLKDFQYVEENKDQGMNVREKSRQLVSLLKDDERLKSERSRALKAKERLAQAISRSGREAAGGSSPGGKDSAESSPDGLSSSRGAVCTELENARPQTAGEEELQLQLALAMSKEEAEQEERLRRNDDLRLQMALTESQENYQKKDSDDTPSASADLLALCSSPTNSTKQNTDPWGMPISNAPPDPWQSASPVTVNENDPWGGTTSPPTVTTGM
ncbi:Epsin-2 [Araneus ventricosus]|uniref:Epsin-2 n=1 Tax=Araneus ventricosus TaxID=182803 RepID=A0A4Y2AHW4_ARAVE|nr:Epsin-2 [Araneus ventricosus]